ncbi:hypothetical protein AB0J72_08225 [Dactylosporangium sp. NPDC049742]
MASLADPDGRQRFLTFGAIPGPAVIIAGLALPVLVTAWLFADARRRTAA